MEFKSIFDSIKKYSSNRWTVVEERDFNSTEKKQVAECSIVDSDYGMSVCFLFVDSNKGYIPLSNNSSLNVGDDVGIEDLKLLTLERDGEKINRVIEK